MPKLKKSELKSKKPLVAKTALKAKKPIATKPKTHTITWYKHEADRVYSLAVRYRFSYERSNVIGTRYADCMTCSISLPIKKLQNGHFMSRQYNSTRYCDQNTAPQCYGCNVMHQGRQYEFGIALDELYGAGTAKRMHDLAKTPHPFKKEELIKIIEEAKEEIRGYESI